MADKLETESSHKGLLSWKGIAAGSSMPMRIIAFSVFVICVIALSLTQLGMYHFGGSLDSSAAMSRLIMIPVAVAALLFGAVAGAATGAFAGVVALVHAMVFPADFYEAYYIGVGNSVVLTAVTGFAFGVIFAMIDRRVESSAKRIAAISASVLAVTAISAALFYQLVSLKLSMVDRVEMFNMYLEADILLAALLEALSTAIVCVVVDRVARALNADVSNRRLGRLFQGWLLLVMLVVFMIIGSAQFVGVTLGELDTARADMKGEFEYLGRQLNHHGIPAGTVLDGYDTDLDGYLNILQDGYVVGTNDSASYIGMPVDELLGAESLEEGQEVLDSLCDDDGFLQAEMVFDDGHTELTYVKVSKEGDYYIVIGYPGSKVYAERPITIGWTTLATVIQLLGVFLLAAILLNRIVVRRIDETNETLGRITDGNLNERVTVRDSKEFASLAEGINTTVAALKDSIVEAEQRNAQELMTAKAIQESSLPTDFPPYPDIDTFDIYASMKTAKEVGGDFYDFFLIGEDRLVFLVADVSGKGIPAALFMMTAKTQIQTYMETGLTVAAAMDAANHQLCLKNDTGMFVTVFACILDYKTGVLTYVNAGHNPPLILHDGRWEWMRDVSGMPMGLFDGIPYDQFERQLDVNDMLYLYTDGVTEAMNADGTLFGEDLLEQTLYDYVDMNPRSVGVGVRRAITDFTLDAEQSDDITMLILKYGVPPATKAIMVLPADDSQLVHVFNYIHAELHRRGAPKSVRNPIDIAAEELFVNVCHYAYPDATPENPGEVRISFEYNPNPPSLTVEIADDGIPYNPLEKPDAVTPDDVMEVPIGGLGILMAKNSVDEMAYERIGESNVLTFRKSW